MRYGMGLEIAQSDSLALKYYAEACELDDANGCHYLADMYAQGKGIQKDEAKATEFYKKACDLGSNKACTSIK
jgi:TPR repeat protein